MNNKKDLCKKDWYKVLNENLKNVKIDFDNIKYKSHKILNEQEKFNKINFLSPNLGSKYQEKYIKEQSKIQINFQGDNRLFVKRLNLNNYKAKTHFVNTDTLILQDILGRIDKFNTKKLYKTKYKSMKEESFNLNEKTFSKKFMDLSTSIKKRYKEIIAKKKKEGKNINLKKNNNSLSKTLNSFNNDKSVFCLNSFYFPNIKNKKNEKKSKIMKKILFEENKSVNKAKSISDKILKLNKDFIKNKKLICGYNDKEEDYIVINNKKIYQINVEKEINKKFQKKKFLNIKIIKDIEEKFLNDNDKIFDRAKKDLMLIYKLKKKNIDSYFQNEDE